MSADTTSPSLRILERRAAIASVLLAANAALGFIMLVPAASAFFALDEGSIDAAWIAGIVGIVGIAVGTMVAFCMWFHRAAKNLRELEPERTFTMTPGWAVGWFFVPFANLIKPLHAAHEIWFWSRPEGRDGALSIGKAVPALLTGWWVAWIASNFIDRAAGKVGSAALDFLSVGANLAAAALCIVVVRTITSMQRARFEAIQPMPPVARDIGHVATDTRAPAADGAGDLGA